MTQTALTVIITASGIVISTLVSVFIAGTRWGEVRSEMRYMNDRLAKIEGMFTLTPKEVERMNKSD